MKITERAARTKETAWAHRVMRRTDMSGMIGDQKAQQNPQYGIVIRISELFQHFDLDPKKIILKHIPGRSISEVEAGIDYKDGYRATNTPYYEALETVFFHVLGDQCFSLLTNNQSISLQDLKDRTEPEVLQKELLKRINEHPLLKSQKDETKSDLAYGLSISMSNGIAWAADYYRDSERHKNTDPTLLGAIYDIVACFESKPLNHTGYEINKHVPENFKTRWHELFGTDEQRTLTQESNLRSLQSTCWWSIQGILHGFLTSRNNSQTKNLGALNRLFVEQLQPSNIIPDLDNIENLASLDASEKGKIANILSTTISAVVSSAVSKAKDAPQILR